MFDGMNYMDRTDKTVVITFLGLVIIVSAFFHGTVSEIQRTKQEILNEIKAAVQQSKITLDGGKN